MALLTQYFRSGVGRLRNLWVDRGYQAGWLRLWGSELKRAYKIDLEVSDHAGKGFQVVPWRWAVERTFAGLLTERRHSQDYERSTTNSEAMI